MWRRIRYYDIDVIFCDEQRMEEEIMSSFVGSEKRRRDRPGVSESQRLGIILIANHFRRRISR